MKPKNIFVLGYFGWYNVGDDAIGYSILKELSKRYCSSKIFITAKNNYFLDKNFPNSAVKKVNFDIYSIVKTITICDKFIISGGTHFTDDDSNELRRIKINTFFFMITLYARIIGRKPVLLGHGIGPIKKCLSKEFLKKILDNSRFVFVRDVDSYNVVKSLGYVERCSIGFDCATILTKDFSRTRNSIDTIGISIFPAYTIYKNTPEKDEIMLNRIVKTIHSTFVKYPKVKFKLFAFNELDVKFLENLCTQANIPTSNIEVIKYHGDLTNFLTQMSDCYIFMGMKYHSSLFAYLFGKPLVIMEYMGKCRSLAETIKIPEKAVISTNEICKCGLSDQLEDLILHPEEYKANLQINDALEMTNEMFDKMDQYIYD